MRELRNICTIKTYLSNKTNNHKSVYNLTAFQKHSIEEHHKFAFDKAKIEIQNCNK